MGELHLPAKDTDTDICTCTADCSSVRRRIMPVEKS
jgi:hypothetical protein